MPPRLNLVGQSFGQLLCLKMVGTGDRGYSIFEWQCSCGNRLVRPGYLVKGGGIKSCGCIKAEVARRNGRKAKAVCTTHGKYKTPEYRSWHSMMDRCYNAEHPHYHRYGGRGIVVCARWRKSVVAFIEDMGKRPRGHTLDRRNNDRGYSPSNCRWLSKKLQNRNMRGNVSITAHGQTKLICEWAEELGIKYETIRSRIRKGWPQEHCIRTAKCTHVIGRKRLV